MKETQKQHNPARSMRARYATRALLVWALVLCTLANACSLRTFMGSGEDTDARNPAALPLTETIALEENGTLIVSCPDSFEAISEEGRLELIAPDASASIVIYPLKRNLEGYSFDTLTGRLDTLTRDPILSGPLALIEARNEKKEGTDTPLHKAYYRSNEIHRMIVYCDYREDYSVFGFLHSADEATQRRYEATADAVFAAIAAAPDERLPGLLAENDAFAPVPYTPWHYAQLTQDFDRGIYDRLWSDMRAFNTEDIPLEGGLWWLDYSVLADSVVRDHPALKPYYYSEFAARTVPVLPQEGDALPAGEDGVASPESTAFFEEAWNRKSFRVEYRLFRKDAGGETTDTETMRGISAEIDAKADAIIAAMPKGLTVYGKYRYLAEEVFSMIEYDMEAANRLTEASDYQTHLSVSSVYSAFIAGRAICGGYATAYQYLCERADLNCRSVGTDDHMLNLIDLYGGTYYVDPTNGITPFADARFAFSHDALLADDFYSEVRGAAEDIATGAAYYCSADLF
jgi:hypothetical protein